MRQDIAYVIIALMVTAGILLWWLSSRRNRRGRSDNLRIDLFKRDDR